MTQWRIVLIEVLGIAATLAGIVDAIRERSRAPIPQQVLNDGRKSLRSDYRRKIDRTLGGWIRRMKVGVDVAVRRLSRRKQSFA